MIWILALFIIGVEIILRFYGFCNSPLYFNNEWSGYSLVPNQYCFKLRNRYITNEYGMRSEPLKDGERRILLIGDSVLNGGARVGHASLASTLLEDHFTPVRVLNISAPGWGIDNGVGVIKKYGDFDAEAIVIVLNSHDAIGHIPDYPIAGHHKTFPQRQYLLAWFELIDRYFIPRAQKLLGMKNDIDDFNTSVGNEHSKGWEWIADYCSEKKIPLAIYLHATTDEILAGKYDENGKWIQQFAAEKNISIYEDIDSTKPTDFIDDCHLNAEGQKAIYDILKPVIGDFLKKEGAGQ